MFVKEKYATRPKNNNMYINNSLGSGESYSICLGLLHRYNIPTSENKYHFSKHQTKYPPKYVSSLDCFEIKLSTSTNNDIITLN